MAAEHRIRQPVRCERRGDQGIGGPVTQLLDVRRRMVPANKDRTADPAATTTAPTIRPARPPVRPRACDMLHTNQADAPRSKGSQWAMWVQDEFGFADGRYTLTPALRYDHYKQKPESTAGYASNPNAGPLPSANSAGRFSPKLLDRLGRAADELTAYTMRLKNASNNLEVLQTQCPAVLQRKAIDCPGMHVCCLLV
ncbi:hypothetical protein FQR65_LT18310 [Abscondita terminalis]|nr:hypothetical protein FQR65_LT18310 [Abscondita terminalis]